VLARWQAWHRKPNTQNLRLISAPGGSTPDVITQCVNLRKGKKIKTSDAIIAATALVYGYTIITNNEKDFANIKGLKIINPHKV